MIELSALRDFRIDDRLLCRRLCADPPARVRDLLRIAMAVYVSDRRKKRRYDTQNGPSRDMRISVGVSDLDFWTAGSVAGLVCRAAELLSGDRWCVGFEFEKPAEHDQRCLQLRFEEQPVVTLYSGGLDSAAGLAARLGEQCQPVVAVTARHQPGQKEVVTGQLKRLREEFPHNPITSAMVRTTLRNPPSANDQELTQRCRAFLFTALAGVVAYGCEASVVEVLENGVGVINLPLMTGMLVGGRTTRGAHPEFLRIMSDLLTKVTERQIRFTLPHQSKTKAELVQCLKGGDRLRDVALSSVSCVHYPRRISGPAKQCGVCLACLGRRQALICAGISEPPDHYEFDLFGEVRSANAVPNERLAFLKATLMHIASLHGIVETPELSPLLRSHLYGSRVLQLGEAARPSLDVLERFREEWLALIRDGQAHGRRWARLYGQLDSRPAQRSVA